MCICFPGMCSTVISYFCAFSSIPRSLLVAWSSGFFTIAWSGLLSLMIWVCRPIVYWWHLVSEKVISNISFSSWSYRHSVGVSARLAYALSVCLLALAQYQALSCLHSIVSPVTSLGRSVIVLLLRQPATSLSWTHHLALCPTPTLHPCWSDSISIS